MKSEVLKTNYFMQQRTRKLHVGEWTLFLGVCVAYCFCLFSEREREAKEMRKRNMIKVYCMRNTLNERKKENFKERPWEEKALDFHQNRR